MGQSRVWVSEDQVHLIAMYACLRAVHFLMDENWKTFMKHCEQGNMSMEKNTFQLLNLSYQPEHVWL